MSEMQGAIARRQTNLPRPGGARASALPTRRTSRPGAPAARDPSPAPPAQAYAARKQCSTPQRHVVSTRVATQPEEEVHTPTHTPMHTPRARGDSPAPRQASTAMFRGQAPALSLQKRLPAPASKTRLSDGGRALAQKAQTSSTASRVPGRTPIARARTTSTATSTASRVSGAVSPAATSHASSQPRTGLAKSQSRVRAPSTTHTPARSGRTLASGISKPTGTPSSQIRHAASTRRASAAGATALPDRGDYDPNAAKATRVGLTPSKYTRRISGSGVSTPTSTARKLNLGSDIDVDDTQLGVQKQSSLPHPGQRRTSGASNSSVLQSFRAARRASNGGDDDSHRIRESPTMDTVSGLSSLRTGGPLSKLRSKGHQSHLGHLPDRDDSLARQALATGTTATISPGVEPLQQTPEVISPLMLSQTTATTTTSTVGTASIDEVNENAAPENGESTPGPNSNRRWSSMSERFANANINTDKVDRMAKSIGGRRSRGMSQSGALEPFPVDTPRLRRSSVQLSKRLVLGEASSDSSSESSSSESSVSSSFSDDSDSSTRATFASYFPDRGDKKEAFTVSTSSKAPARQPFAPANVNDNNADLSWIDRANAASPPLF